MMNSGKYIPNTLGLDMAIVSEYDTKAKIQELSDEDDFDMSSKINSVVALNGGPDKNILNEKDKEIEELRKQILDIQEDLLIQSTRAEEFELKCIEEEETRLMHQRKMLKYKKISASQVNKIREVEDRRSELEIANENLEREKDRSALEIKSLNKQLVDQHKVIKNQEKLIQQYILQERKRVVEAKKTEQIQQQQQLQYQQYQQQQQQIYQQQLLQQQQHQYQQKMWNIVKGKKPQTPKVPACMQCCNPKCKHGGKIYPKKDSFIQLKSCDKWVHTECFADRTRCHCGIIMQ